MRAINEHIYFGSTPIAAVKNGVVYYVHTDHLGTPRAISNQNGNLVWKWENLKAYGNNLAEENLSGTPFEYNLRFPGQFFDKESGLHYNKNRTYYPELGRYLQKDPIGVNGGMNTYSYTENNPLNLIDPEGLANVAREGNTIIFQPIIAVQGFITPEYVNSLNKIVNQMWNNENWYHRTCRVKFDIKFTLDKGSEYDFLFTVHPVNKRGTSKVYANKTGEIYTNDIKNFSELWAMWAHEVGHVMGLKDEYEQQLNPFPIYGKYTRWRSSRTNQYRRISR